MGLFSRKKKKKKELVESSLEGIKERLFEERDTLEDLTDLKSLINKLLDDYSKSKNALLSLMKAKNDEEVNKAVLVGVNNSRRQISALLSPFLNFDEPKDFAELTELIDNTRKLMLKAQELGPKHGSTVSRVFKDELRTLGSALEELADSFKELKKVFDKRDLRITRIQAALFEVHKFERLINKCNSFNDKRKELAEAKQSLIQSKEGFQEKLSKLKESEELEKAKINKEKVRRLNSKIDQLNKNFLNSYSDFSKAAKKFVNNNEFLSSIVRSLERKPLETLKNNFIPVSNLFNNLRRSLELGQLELKPKQLVKSIKSLRLINPQIMLDDYESLLSELKTITVDESIIDKVEEKEHSLIRISNEVVHLDKNAKALEEDEVKSRKLIEPLKSKLEASISEVLDCKIRITD